MDIQSPCRSTCVYNGAKGWCEGCFRTIEEITSWSQASDQEKHDILAAAEQRRVTAMTPLPPKAA